MPAASGHRLNLCGDWPRFPRSQPAAIKAHISRCGRLPA